MNEYVLSDGVAELDLGEGRVATIDARDLHLAQAFSWKPRTHGRGPVYAWAMYRVSPGKKGKRIALLHRVILGAAKGTIVDHRNGNGLDCRRENLRITDQVGNARNITLSPNQKRGGFKGVCWLKREQRWRATIKAGDLQPNGSRKAVFLGHFDDPVSAARAYDAAAQKYFGEFASLNFPAAAQPEEKSP